MRFYQLRIPILQGYNYVLGRMHMFNFGSKYKNFWKWFLSHEDEMFHFEADQERVFDKLAMALRRVHPDLVFEFSSIQNGRREFVISAAGIKKAFPEVTALV